MYVIALFYLMYLVCMVYHPYDMIRTYLCHVNILKVPYSKSFYFIILLANTIIVNPELMRMFKDYTPADIIDNN